MRKIVSRYSGKCATCSREFQKGDWIYWAKGQKAKCVACGDNATDNARRPIDSGPVTAPTFSNEPVSTIGSQTSADKSVKAWSVDWSDLKETCLKAIRGEKVCNSESNQRTLAEALRGNSWKGYDSSDVERWLKTGFQIPALTLGDPPVPIREKRRLIYQEEGDEFHYDMAMSGDEKYFSDWTKREVIPGLAIEAQINFSGDVSSVITQAYYSWLCRMVYSLEENGVDCQVSLFMPNTYLFQGEAGTHRRTLIRVKKENEISDFAYWSGMISPAALRSYGFAAKTLYADAENRNVATGFGRLPTGIPEAWSVVFEGDNRVLRISVPWNKAGYSFPEESMTKQLHEALSKTR